MAKRCDQCLTEGITLFPSRWGGMFEGTKIRSISRLLREGYIYIIDNKGNWYGYIVTQGRYLKDFDVKNVAKTPDLPLLDATCFKGDNCTALNSFIRIPNPKRDITTLWCAYSPVKWTKAVIDRHTNNTDGAKTNNMIEVPVSATQSKSTVSLSIESQNAGSYDLWQYNPEDDNKEKVYQYFAIEYFGNVNPFTKQPYNPDKVNEMQSLKTELTKIDDSGNRVLSIEFNDPVGKLIDLNELMINIEDYYDSELLKKLYVKSFEEVNRKVVVAETILDIKKQIKENAFRFSEKKKLESLVNPHGSSVDLFSSKEDLMKKYYNNNWKDGFKELVRYDEMTTWLSFYQSNKKNNEINRREKLAAISKEYNNKWFSEDLHHEMTCNFDDTDVESCASYTLIVQEFIGSTSKYSEISEYYTNLLSFHPLLKSFNYLGRALCFNNKNIINNIESVTAAKGITLEGITTLSWSAAAGETLSEIRKKYLGNLKRHGTTITLEQLIFDPYLYVRKVGTETKATSTLYPYIQLGRSDLLMSVFTRRPLSVVTIDGNLKDITKGVYGLLKTELSKNGGSKISNNKLKDAASQFIDQLEREDITVDKKISTKVTVFVDIDALTNANDANSSANIAKSIMTDRRLQFDEFKNFYRSQASKSGVGNLGGALQVLCCLSLFKGLVASSDNDAKEPLHKFGASIAILAGGVVQHRADVVGLRRELYGAVPTNSPHRQLKLARMVEGTEIAYSSLKFGARTLNIGGAAVFAYYDYQAAQTSFENNDDAMGALYITSAGSGLISTGLLVSGVSVSWVPVAGWVILGVSIVTGLAIMWFQKTPLENWVKYGTWGVENKSWTFEKEQDNFEKASSGEEITL